MGTAGSPRETWGVLGGMGPLASVEFVKTIYEFASAGQAEQQMPVVFLLSDPTFPDRTAQILDGDHRKLLNHLADRLEVFHRLEVTNVVICCITIHYLLAYLPGSLRGNIVSLLDVIFEAVLRTKQRQLLLCTRGTQQAGLFQAHPLWPEAKRFLVLPDDHDQDQIHRMIYEIKRGMIVESHCALLRDLMSKYGLDSFIAGCTEIHVLSRTVAFEEHKEQLRCIDPLSILASRIALGADANADNLQFVE